MEIEKASMKGQREKSRQAVRRRMENGAGAADSTIDDATSDHLELSTLDKLRPERWANVLTLAAFFSLRMAFRRAWA